MTMQLVMDDGSPTIAVERQMRFENDAATAAQRKDKGST